MTHCALLLKKNDEKSQRRRESWQEEKTYFDKYGIVLNGQKFVKKIILWGQKLFLKLWDQKKLENCTLCMAVAQKIKWWKEPRKNLDRKRKQKTDDA